MQPGKAPAPAQPADGAPPPSGKQTRQTAIALSLLALVLGLYGLSQLWGAVDWLISLGPDREPFVRAGMGIIGLAVAAGAARAAQQARATAQYAAVAAQTVQEAPALGPAPTSAAAPLSAGMAVSVHWTDGNAYPARVVTAHGGAVLCAFPNGSEEWIPSSHVAAALRGSGAHAGPPNGVRPSPCAMRFR